MVKRLKKHHTKKHVSKGCKDNSSKPRKIKASTAYGTCTERLSPFGGLLALIKFLDLMKFEEIFDHTYRVPTRRPKLGHYLDGCLYLDATVHRVQPIVAFYIYSFGRHGLRIFSAHSLACGQYLLTLYR